MIQKIEQNDCVIGSRYIAGGGVKGWRIFRKTISIAGSFYARRILNIPIHDLTGGFNIWKRSVLKRLDLNNIRSEGYAFQIELKYKAIKKGFPCVEFPIIFEGRFLEKSKMSIKIFLEAIFRLWQMKLNI